MSGLRKPNFRAAVVWLSALLLVSMWLCYALQSDRFAAVTIWPSWAWVVPGLVLLAFSGRSTTARAKCLVALAWLAYIAMVPEEPRSLMRGLSGLHRPAQVQRGKWRAVRVVTLNCSAGSSEAAEEVIDCKPDIVLLQESPEKKTVFALARRLFAQKGSAVSGLDTSIIARGRVTPLAVEEKNRIMCISALVVLDSKCRVQVMSVRLTPPLARFDLWSPDDWREHTENRMSRREQISDLVGQIGHLDRSRAVIVGGDMNAVGGDGAFRDMRSYLRDSFFEGGRGWCNTVLNDVPLQRIDQVWINDGCRAVSVTARKTVNSDHRMVVCDLLVREK